MSNSPLVNHINLSPNHSGQRNHKIDTITIHHMAGNLSVEACGRVFEPTSREASSNYAVDSLGRVGMYVEEHNRSWCSSSSANDNRAVTIEVANDEYGGNWHVSDVALQKTIDLCVDICQRNGIKALNYTGDTRGNLTKHEWFANTNCPGPYLGSKFPYIASEVNKRLKGNNVSVKPASDQLNGLYRVRQSWQDSKSQKGAFKHLDNAKSCADKHSGYKVFDEQGHIVYPIGQTNTLSLDDISKEVIDGKWGNGAQHKSALASAGCDYDKVQQRVNELVSGKATSSLKSVDEVAREVIHGKWGNGQDRKNRLSQAGYDYHQIQQRVNELL
ncbi:N-acetylmuramoyl-L-alanine amidase [Aerococcaceae bacterium NML191219]|nr:N-acetylmuramoyl-L-alanine amidase [Aerococcaceae bacterium NML191219]